MGKMDNTIPKYLLKTIKYIYRYTKFRIKFNDSYIVTNTHKQRSKTGMCPFTGIIQYIHNKIVQEFKT